MLWNREHNIQHQWEPVDNSKSKRLCFSFSSFSSSSCSPLFSFSSLSSSMHSSYFPPLVTFFTFSTVSNFSTCFIFSTFSIFSTFPFSLLPSLSPTSPIIQLSPSIEDNKISLHLCRGRTPTCVRGTNADLCAGDEQKCDIQTDRHTDRQTCIYIYIDAWSAY